MCKPIWKTGCIVQPIFNVLLLNILTVKLDSPSEKPVKNQGFKLFNFGLVSKFVDKEVYDLLNVINWLEGILI